MEKQVLTTNVKQIIEAAGMHFDVFEFKFGKYAMYNINDVAEFIAMSENNYESICASFRDAMSSEYA